MSSSLRIGQGYDTHKLVPGIPLYLGGQLIEAPFGSLGHSDGDALLHALIDSLLGALAKGDIGTWFPDTDPALKGIRSTLLLDKILRSDELPCFEFVNLDMTIFMNKPKLSPWREKIVKSISSLLKFDENRINLKAKTWEGLGRENLLACSCTALIDLGS